MNSDDCQKFIHRGKGGAGEFRRADVNFGAIRIAGTQRGDGGA
ncbi:MAG: hypothetical protein OXI01_16135 [Albidovulum sp.]|nr:hypothetical protein [Albidovulum sp.]